MVYQLQPHTVSFGVTRSQNTKNKHWIPQMEKEEKRHNWDESNNSRTLTPKQKRLYPKPFGDPLNLREILGLKPIGGSEDEEDYLSRNVANFQGSRAEGTSQTNACPMYQNRLEKTDQRKIGEEPDDSGSSRNFIYCEEEHSWRFFDSDDLKENGEFPNAVATSEVSTNSHTSNNQKEKIQKSFMDSGTYWITTNHQESGFMTAKKSSEVTEAKTIGLESDGSCTEDAMKMEIFGQMTGKDWQNTILGSNLKTSTPMLQEIKTNIDTESPNFECDENQDKDFTSFDIYDTSECINSGF